MEKILCEDEYGKIYIRFVEDFDVIKPCVAFIIGVEMNLPSWVGGQNERSHFKAEDGFNMFGEGLDKFMKELRLQNHNYQEKQLRIEDYLQDTDGFIELDCKLDKVEIEGQLGATFELPTFNFKYTADSSILANLYDALKENISL